MDRQKVDKWLERGILAVVLVILVFGPLALGGVRNSEFSLLLVLGVLAAGLWVARLWVWSSDRILLPPLGWVLAVGAAYALGRYSFAEIEYVSRIEVVRILLYLLLFFVIACNLHRQETMQLIVTVLIVLGTVLSLYAIYQFITRSDRVWHFVKPLQYLKRGSGTYICPNHLAGFLEMLLPLAVALTFMSRLGITAKVVLGYGAVMMLAGIGATVSRAGALVAAVTGLILFGFLFRYRQYRIAALAVLVLLLGTGIVFLKKVPLSKARFEQLVAREKTEENFRLMLWPTATAIWRENFWWGAGLGHYDFKFRQVRPPAIQWRPERVHNDYLNTLADLGLVGFGILLAAIATLLLTVVKTWKFVRRDSDGIASKKSNKTAMVLGLALGLLAIGLHSFFDFNLHIPANAITVITLAALLSAHLRFATDRFWVRVGVVGRLALTVGFVAISSYLVIQAVRLRKESHWLDIAARLPRGKAERKEYLLKAFAVEPKNAQTAYELGEEFRVQSWQGGAGYEKAAQEAMHWFGRTQQLNRYEAYGFMRYGMCLDWLDRHDQAEPYYEQAAKIDPNGYFVAAHYGWHYLQKEDLPRAKRWFDYSMALKPHDNPVAYVYLDILRRRMPPSK